MRTFFMQKASVLERQDKMEEVLLHANNLFRIHIQNFINLILQFCQEVKNLKKKLTK